MALTVVLRAACELGPQSPSAVVPSACCNAFTSGRLSRKAADRTNSSAASVAEPHTPSTFWWTAACKPSVTDAGLAGGGAGRGFGARSDVPNRRS